MYNLAYHSHSAGNKIAMLIAPQAVTMSFVNKVQSVSLVKIE